MSHASRAPTQLSLPVTSHKMPAEAYAYGERSDGQTHGLVLTRPHIVDLMLDLAGYLPDRDLGALSLLEPACGHGAFLSRAVERLCLSAARFSTSPVTMWPIAAALLPRCCAVTAPRPSWRNGWPEGG